MKPESHLVPIERPKKKTDIRWQVHEWLFPKSPSLYAAVNPLIREINEILSNPNISSDEKWLFLPKEGKPPNIHFFMYENTIHNRQITALVFDHAFAIHALTVHDHIVAIPMGHTSKIMYTTYWTAKRPEKSIPPFPKDVVEGYLRQDPNRFALDAIFLNGWDRRPQYEAANAFPGFSTQEYDTIIFLHNYSPEYRAQLVEKLLAKHKNLPFIDQIQKQLLSHNP